MSESHLPLISQLELPIGRPQTPDRNASKGGRSFYFFDFDDNIMRLDTCIYVFNRKTGAEIPLTTRRFAELHPCFGKPGAFEHFELRPDDHTGSYRRFRDFSPEELAGRSQPFIEDLLAALAKGDILWKGPSWSFFFHAVFNNRPIAVITARGHHPNTMRSGIGALTARGYLSTLPNYLGIYPVSHPDVRADLGDPDQSRPIPELKKVAIIRSVEMAMQRYGENPYHRFGMSDDDPKNVALIVEAMIELKQRFPKNAFFVINTSTEPAVKTEILTGRTSEEHVAYTSQLRLFDG